MDIDKLAHEIRQIKEAFAVFSPEKIHGVLADIAKLRADIEPMLAEWRQFKDRDAGYEKNRAEMIKQRRQAKPPKVGTSDAPVDIAASESTGQAPAAEPGTPSDSGQPKPGDTVT